MDEPNGLEIKDAIEGYYDESINHGRLYPNLDDLHEKELLSKEKEDGRTNIYGVTSQGQETIRQRNSWNKTRSPQATSKNLKQEA